MFHSELGLINGIFYGAKTWLICYLPDRRCLQENEENKNRVSKNRREREEFLARLRDCLDPDKKNEKATDEDLILKVSVCRFKKL